MVNMFWVIPTSKFFLSKVLACDQYNVLLSILCYAFYSKDRLFVPSTYHVITVDCKFPSCQIWFEISGLFELLPLVITIRGLLERNLTQHQMIDQLIYSVYTATPKIWWLIFLSGNSPLVCFRNVNKQTKQPKLGLNSWMILKDWKSLI